VNQTVDDDTVGSVEFCEYLTYREITYGATACVINIGLVEMNAFAVFSQKEGEDRELWASTKTDCQDFLEQHGCPRRLAQCLLLLADEESRITKVRLPQPDQVEILQ